VRAGLGAGLSFLDDEGQWAEVLVLEAPVGGANTCECTRRVHQGLLPVLEAAREEIIIGAEIRPPTWLIAELLTLAVLSALRARLLRSEDTTRSELAAQLMAHIVEPYLAKAAARIDEKRDGRVRSHVERTEMVPIRPHPRTMQALRAIASAPALSSREVGRAVGVDNNSGHITKLLGRLENRGLIENASHRRTERERSTWFLTPYGQRVLEVVSRTYRAAREDDVLSQLDGAMHNSFASAAQADRNQVSLEERL
jgi:DNA-binding MarR family transcriptional regulator